MIFPKSKKVKHQKHDQQQQETVNSIHTLDSQLSINDYFKMKMFNLLLFQSSHSLGTKPSVIKWYTANSGQLLKSPQKIGTIVKLGC